MRITEKEGLGRVGWGRLALLAACGLSVTVVACSTDLTNPDLITRSVALDTANISSLRNGALYEFARALAGPAENNDFGGIITQSALLADEAWYASSFPTTKEIDERDIDPQTNSDLETVFYRLQRARNLADQTAELYTQSSEANSADQALVTNLAGFTYVLFAENYCSGVPFTVSPLTGGLQYGPGQTTEQMLDTAVVRFDAAMQTAQAAGSTEQLNLARVGKARALLDKGDFAGAAAAAKDVPADFGYYVEYSAGPTANNGVWYNFNSELRASAATDEGGNGLHYFNRGDSNVTIDPRVPADSSGLGLGTSTQHYNQGKYTSKADSIPLATGLEAQLIQAEALLDQGNSGAYLPILNSLRSQVGLDALTDPGSADGRVRQFFSERAKWLWLTAHRLGDMRREVRQYGLDANTVFPVGKTIFGVQYGTDVNLPIPFSETNNPSYSGQCIDRNA